MKTNLYAGIMVGALLAGPAAAVTKCVALDSSTTCAGSAVGNSADWSATCTTGNTGIPIQGIAFCSNQQDGGPSAKSSTITVSSISSENSNCWCKMVSPAVSSWVSIGRFSGCEYDCSRYCLFSTQDNSVFRSALFSDLSD